MPSGSIVPTLGVVTTEGVGYSLIVQHHLVAKITLTHA